jgi:hypothetical protein
MAAITFGIQFADLSTTDNLMWFRHRQRSEALGLVAGQDFDGFPPADPVAVILGTSFAALNARLSPKLLVGVIDEVYLFIYPCAGGTGVFYASNARFEHSPT